MNLPVKSEHGCALLPSGANRSELEENVELLRQASAFSGVPFDKLKLLAYLGRRLSFRPRESLFRQGNPDTQAYLVISGKAQIVREYRDYCVVVNGLEEGDLIGGLALVADVNRPFSVWAVTPLTCLALNRDSFQKALAQCPEVALKVMEAMIKRLLQMVNSVLDHQVREQASTIPHGWPPFRVT